MIARIEPVLLAMFVEWPTGSDSLDKSIRLLRFGMQRRPVSSAGVGDVCVARSEFLTAGPPPRQHESVFCSQLAPLVP